MADHIIIWQKEVNIDLNRVIFHIDVNSAFLSWKAVYRLHHLGGQMYLRDQISAVGGDMAMRHEIYWQNLSLPNNIISEPGKRLLKRAKNTRI